MHLISAEGYTNAKDNFLRVKETGEIWVIMKNNGLDVRCYMMVQVLHNGLGVKNMSDSILKEIYGRYGTKNLEDTNQKIEIRRYKMTEWETFEKYNN